VIKNGTGQNWLCIEICFAAGMMQSINGNFVIAKPLRCSKITINKEDTDLRESKEKT